MATTTKTAMSSLLSIAALLAAAGCDVASVDDGPPALPDPITPPGVRPDGGAGPVGDDGDGAMPEVPTCPGAPIDPVTHEEICPPYDRPAVFFSPHPDDESLFMGGAIVEHLAAGRPVFIELMTAGTATGVRTALANGGTDPWHSGVHAYNLSPPEIGEARVREFLDAAARLGVTGVYISEFGDQELTADEVQTRARWWIDTGAPGLSLKGTYTGHVDHVAVWNGLVASGHADIRGYSIASAYHSRVDDISSWCQQKSAALAAYEVWIPAAGRFAVGAHSSADLIAQARSDCHEYVVVP